LVYFNLSQISEIADKKTANYDGRLYNVKRKLGYERVVKHIERIRKLSWSEKFSEEFWLKSLFAFLASESCLIFVIVIFNSKIIKMSDKLSCWFKN
jgi:hypothetical protein